MNVRPDNLAAHLKRELEPLYVVHGDEPLLAIEAGDAIRDAARNAGANEREVLVVEPGFKWHAFVGANANASLFGDRRVVDLRIPTGKPGVEGAKVLEAYAAKPNPDNITLITLPRLDKATQATDWFSALAQHGVTIAVAPLERDALPHWIAARLARQHQQASPQTLAFLADRCEGNLLAARQEIEKLGLVLGEGTLDADAVEAAVADVARFDVFAASDAWLRGDAGRALRVLSVLESEGDGPQLALWTLGEDLHALAGVQAMIGEGMPMAVALRNARVWGKRQVGIERAAKRVSRPAVERLLAGLAQADAVSKGIGTGNAWDLLTLLALDFTGAPALPIAHAS